MNPKTVTAEGLIKASFKTKFFRPRAGPLFAGWTRSKGSNLVVIVGDNATGKSFYRRVVHAVCAHHCEPALELIHLSMEKRTHMGELNMMRSFIYGDENYQATGVNSVNVIDGAINTSSKRTTPHAIFFDEPDIGLSDEYAMGAAKRIVYYCGYAGDLTRAIFVVTHRRSMVEVLLRFKPHVLIFGKDRPASIQEWLERERKPKGLTELAERGHALFQALLPLLKEK